MQRLLVPLLVSLSLALGAAACGEDVAPAGVPDVRESTITAESPVPADGQTVSNVTVTVLDAYGDPVSGITVAVLSDRAGDNVVQPPAATGADGVAVARITSTEPGTAELSAEVDGRALVAKATVEFEGCENTDTDPLNCGFCGNVCPDPANGTATCTAGSCGFECEAGFADCDGQPENGCEQALDSAETCGSCVNACPVGDHGAPTCVDADAGTCGFTCESGWADCNGVLSDGCERNVNTANACGTCDNTCPEGPNGTPICADAATATCGFDCDIGWGDCNGNPADGCEARLDSPAACGSCENVCEAGDHARATCAPASGTCGVSCDNGWLDCDDDETNGCEAQYGSADACGSCDVVCAAGANAVAVCLSPETGSCGSECAAGWGDCDTDPSTCETALDTLTDCGACGNACPTGGANGQAVCDPTSLTCDVQCVSGFADCNLDPTDGCEQDLSQGDCCVGGYTIGQTSTCITAGASSVAVVYAEITDGAGSPFTGGTVSVDSAGLNLSATATEYGTTGHYWFEITPPQATGTFTVDLTADAAACGMPVFLGTLEILVVDPVDYADGGTGGCAPMDGNLRVRVVDEAGAPLAGAFVMVDRAASTAAFADVYTDALAGTPAQANYLTTDAQGYAYFTDFAGGLDGSHTVTAGASDRAYVTLAGFESSDLVLALPAIPTPTPDVTIQGSVVPSYVANSNGRVELALVTPVLDLEFLIGFRIENLFEDSRPANITGSMCPATGSFLVSENIEIPTQREGFGLCTIAGDPENWTLTPESGAPIDVVAVQASADIMDLQNASTTEDMAQFLRLDKIGLRSNVATGANQTGVDITLDQNLTETLPFTVSNAPMGDLWVVAAGDLDGQYGNGRMILEGLSVAADATGHTGTLRTAPSAGVFAGKQDLVMAIAFPASGGASAALDRTTTDTSTARTLDRFFAVPNLTNLGRSFTWSAVSTGTTPGPIHVARSVLRRMTSTGEYQNRAEPFWIVYSPGNVSGFELPVLPPTAPRAASGGYLSTGAGQWNSWQLGLMHLGLDPTVDLRAFELGSETSTFTHLTGSTERIY